MERVRIGFVGCGAISRVHLARLEPYPHAQVVALCDIREEAAVRVRSKYLADPQGERIPIYTDYREMLKAGGLDAVMVMTPHSCHVEQALAALESGCHVLVEKPLALSAAEGEELLAAADRAGKVLVTGYQRRYLPAYCYAREVIARGELGRITFISATLTQNWIREDTWRCDPSLSGGGMLNDSGSHILDIILWVTGLKPVEVAARIDNAGLKVDVTTAISLELEGGAVATIGIHGNAPAYSEQMGIWGEKGALLFRKDSLKYQLADGTFKEIGVEELPQGSDPDAAFLQAIEAGTRIDESNSVQTVALTRRIYQGNS